MKGFRLVSMGAALVALGLGLSSIVPLPARADEGSGNTAEEKMIRIAQDDDRDRDRDRDRDSDSGYLGVQVQRLTASLRRAKGIPDALEGTLVSNVEDGGPADQAGVKRGDVILELNRESTEDPADLVKIVRGLDPGSRATARIWRDGVTRTVTLRLGSRPEGKEAVPPRMPGWERPGEGPDGDTNIILRGNREDLERQVQELKDQIAKLRNEDLARLEREVRELRSDLRRQMDRKDRDQDEDKDRDRDRDNDRDNDGD
jgi:hypothetical protein